MERMWQNVCETVPKSVYRVKQPSRNHRLAAYQNGIWRNKRPPSSTALSLEFPLANEKLTLYLTIFVIEREPLRGITMDFNNVLLTFTTRIKAPLLSCDNVLWLAQAKSFSFWETFVWWTYRTLYSASIGQDFIPVHIYVFAMASTVLTKESTQDDVLQFLEDNSLS